MKVYVASSWRNQYHNKVVQDIRTLGHSVYDYREKGFGWSQIYTLPGDGKLPLKELTDLLNHPLSKIAFSNDSIGIHDSDVAVLVLDSGKSSHIEIGYQFGRSVNNKYSIILIPEGVKVEPELMYSWSDFIINDDISEIRDTFIEIEWRKNNE
jgi:hypothetical protein